MKETKKYRFIDKIESLSKEEKLYAINFFTKFPQYEKYIDWNRCQSLTYKDFEQVFKIAENSRRSLKHKTKSDPQLLFEKYNCKIITQTDDFLIIVPYDWECAVFFNSFNCGGEGARWCIGYKKNPKTWYTYRLDKNLFALLFFTKRHPVFGKKILLQYEPGEKDFIFWNQDDVPLVNIMDHYLPLCDSQEKENPPLYKNLPSEWYSHLLNEKEVSKQLFFEFDIFFGINTEEICDLLPESKILKKDKFSEEICDFLMESKILKRDKFSSSLQNAYKIIEQEQEPILQRIHCKEYYINGSVLVGYCNNQTSEAIIPSDITSIGDHAFDYCYNLTSIVIPDSVTSIGENAFESCENLTSIIIPDSVTSIGAGSFMFCKNFTSINIPNSVTSIGAGTFMFCSNLKSINIPNCVTSIGDHAFYDCDNLRSITIPKSVTSIGAWAFEGCSNLTSIVIPDSVTSIGENAFEGCENLTSVTIPSSVAYIGEGAFMNCINLTTMSIPNNVIFIGKEAFKGCINLTSIDIPNSVTSIGENAFEGCENLTSVTIPGSVTSIGEGTFWNCMNLTAINLPDSVTVIEKNAFSFCESLTSISIPGSVTFIGEGAFRDCINLTSINIPKSITAIGEDVFKSCINLKSVYDEAIFEYIKPILGEPQSIQSYIKTFFLDRRIHS
ncbi:MAG: leucine-rich repeat domain-containing protein [Spirochaetaceae bacterium]|nr:leucine-rich repeat domain-containing protein [Spirochaetaceae bacterium]